MEAPRPALRQRSLLSDKREWNRDSSPLALYVREAFFYPPPKKEYYPMAKRISRLGGLLAAYQRRDPAARSKL